jgi:PAS domain S-box-containing protein
MKNTKVTSRALADPMKNNRISNTLKDSETRFRRLFESAQDGILILDEDTGKINEVNPFLINMLGYSRDEFLGKKLWQIGAFKDIKEIKEEFSKLQRERYVRYEDLPLQARDGHKVAVEFVSNVYTVDGKKVIQCNIRDITDRKRAENNFKQAMDQKLRDEVNNRTVRDRFINAVNSLLRLLGKPTSNQEYADSLVEMLQDWSGCACLGIRMASQGKQLQCNSYKGFRSTYWNVLGEITLEERKRFLEGNFEAIEKDLLYFDSTKKYGARFSSKLKKAYLNIGVRKPYILTVIPVNYDKKTFALIYMADKKVGEGIPDKIKFIKQLTPLIGEGIYKFNMEDKMRGAQQELIQTKRLSDIGTLSATVAHELRNPLAAISLATYSIRAKKEDLPIDRHLDIIDKKIFESDHIISNLLFYSRLKTPIYEPLKIYNVLNECIELVRKRFIAQDVRVVKKLGLIKNTVIQADPYQMKELFVNILNNAFDVVSGKNSVIAIGARLINSRSVEIQFHDNGTGIDSKDILKVFDPFFTTKAKGTGLGLAVCYQIVTLHNGTITVKSPKNKGTTITITLPRNK